MAGVGILESLVRTVVAEEIHDTTVYVLQRNSPLGRNRHVAAVRRRIELGLPGAYRVGRAYMLTLDALREELARIGSQPPHVKAAVKAPASAEPSDEVSAVKAELARKLSACR